MALSLEEKKIQLAVKRGELSEREGIIAKSQLDARNIELEYQKVQIDLAKKQEEIDLAKIENEKQITAEKNKQIELQLNLEKTSKEIASKEQLLSSGKLDTQSYNQVSNEIIKLNSEREKILVDIEKQKNNILNIEKETTSEIIKRQGLLEEEGKQAKDVYVNKQQQRDIQKAIDLTPQIRNMGDMFRDASKGLASSIIGAFRDGGDNAKDKILDALTNFSTKIQDKMIDNMLNKLFSGGGTSGSGGFNVGSIFSNFGSTSGGTNQASSNNFDFSRAADGYWTAIEKTTGSITELDTKCLQVAKSMVGTGDGFGSAVSSMVNGMGSFFSNLFSGGKGGESGGGFKMPSFGSKGKMAMPQMKEMATMAVTMGSGMIAGFMGTGESQIGSAISGIGGAVGSGLMMTGNPIAMGAGAIISIGSALIGGIFGSRAKKKKKAIAKAKEDIKNSINALNITLENISLELEKVIIGFSDIIDGANREISKLDLSKSIWTIQKAINKTLGGSIRKVDEELVSSLEKQRADLASKFSKEADEKLRIELEKAKKGVITPTGILDALEAQRDALAEATQKQLDAVGGTIDYFNSKTGAKYGGSMYGEAIPELKKKIDEIKANFEKSDKEIKKNIADYQDKIQEWMKAQRDLLFNFNREVDREFTVETFGSAGGDIYDQIMAFNDKVVDLLGSGFDPDKVTYIIQRQAIQLQNNLKEKVKQLHNDFAERLIGLQDELFDVLTEGRATGQIQKTQQDKLQDIRRRIDELYAEQQATANSELAGFGTNLSDANKALEYFTNQINENYLEALQNAKSGLTAQEQIQINVYDPAEIARIVEEKLRNNSSLPSFLRQAAV
jgi:phage host-nuclease inhibitor protein Gam